MNLSKEEEKFYKTVYNMVASLKMPVDDMACKKLIARGVDDPDIVEKIWLLGSENGKKKFAEQDDFFKMLKYVAAHQNGYDITQIEIEDIPVLPKPNLPKKSDKISKTNNDPESKPTSLIKTNSQNEEEKSDNTKSLGISSMSIIKSHNNMVINKDIREEVQKSSSIKMETSIKKFEHQNEEKLVPIPEDKKIIKDKGYKKIDAEKIIFQEEDPDEFLKPKGNIDMPNIEVDIDPTQAGLSNPFTIEQSIIVRDNKPEEQKKLDPVYNSSVYRFDIY